ncbi:hypothetical protein [Desulfonema magnum]|uniref:Uncharacterized protein n=1 Tax=Desulfonema magnum TaxID=45655 RepID=A0A975GL34_9BACT|nr:hypothetical protein [Desulfonema magnum]QTA85421.1 Uncharacterized protein dnm_014300 [Desulfonema magnum]
MDKTLERIFPGMTDNECLKIISDILFYVYDNPDTDQAFATVTEPEEHQNFRITNPACKPVRVLSVDHCLFSDDSFKKCDFVLYDEAAFCFVELKAVHRDVHKKRKNAKRYAEKQLLATIELFRKELGNFGGRDLEAYLCVGYRTGRPSILSRSQRAKRDFVRLGVKLYDGCRKEFA